MGFHWRCIVWVAHWIWEEGIHDEHLGIFFFFAACKFFFFILHLDSDLLFPSLFSYLPCSNLFMSRIS